MTINSKKRKTGRSVALAGLLLSALLAGPSFSQELPKGV